MRTARVALSATESGKPKFSRTIEGCEAQCKYYQFFQIPVSSFKKAKKENNFEFKNQILS